MVAVSLLARCAGRIAIESLLSNLNEPRNNIVRGVSVSLASGDFFVAFEDTTAGPRARCTSGYNRACNSGRACNISNVLAGAV